MRRAAELKAHGLHYVDVGTSGGIWGLDRGYCLMIGGEAAVVERLDPIFAALAPGLGQRRARPGGRRWTAQRSRATCTAGRTAPAISSRWFTMASSMASWLPTPKVQYPAARQCRQAGPQKSMPRPRRCATPSIISTTSMSPICRSVAARQRRRSWLLDLTALALGKSPDLANFSGHVSDSGEGRWTVSAAIDEAVPAPVLSAALFARFSSRGEDDFAENCFRPCATSSAGMLEGTEKRSLMPAAYGILF